jgi:hypothetical protein
MQSDTPQGANGKLPPEVPMITQDRAYPSPIWYNP